MNSHLKRWSKWFKLKRFCTVKETIKETKRQHTISVKIFANDIFYNELPQWFSNKESTWNPRDTGDMDLIPGSERSPGGGHGNLLQYSCLENPMDREAWRAIIHRVAKSWTWLKQLSMHILCKKERAIIFFLSQHLNKDTHCPSSRHRLLIHISLSHLFIP